MGSFLPNLTWNRSPPSGNFQHWWTSNRGEPLRSEGQGPLQESLLEPINLLPQSAAGRERQSEYPPRPAVVASSLAWHGPSSHAPRLQVGISCEIHISLSHCPPRVFISFQAVGPLQAQTSGGWSENPDDRATEDTWRCHFFPGLRGAQVSLSSSERQSPSPGEMAEGPLGEQLLDRDWCLYEEQFIEQLFSPDLNQTLQV